ncbi:MAG: NADH-quinone oxidoreductase subunit C [Ignavibacteriaceae bacterium]|nr:NADH-quinone oxidoreductase subunit C [Ignavibacteriaceae bacterium]
MKEKILEVLQNAFPGTEFEVYEFHGDLRLKFPAELVVPVADILKNDPELAFDLLEDVTGIDWATRKNRFSVVYHVFSIKNSFRLRFTVDVDDETLHVDTVTGIWLSANWYERETYDMYGIKFTNHPDLRRMYMPEEYEYHPLRKDYPLMGIPGDLSLPKK